MTKNKYLIPLLLSAGLLAACDDSDSQYTDFNLAISDAPVDDLTSVIVCFNAVELNGQSDLTFEVGQDEAAIAANDICKDEQGNTIPNTVGIDLFEYTGMDAISFISSAQIEAGEYSQLRLQMSPGSYAIIKGTENTDNVETVPVVVPSNELKLDGFTAAIGGVLNFTVEFDLRQGMTNPVGKEEYF